MVVSAKDDKVLGFHMVGTEASEVMQVSLCACLLYCDPSISFHWKLVPPVDEIHMNGTAAAEIMQKRKKQCHQYLSHEQQVHDGQQRTSGSQS